MEKKLNGLDKELTWRRIAVVIFLLYALAGLICFDDYGCGPDEGIERQTSLVNFKYAVQKLHIPISEENKTWLEYLPELKGYRDRYYGTALHFPVVLIESAFHFSLTPSQFYGMRHFYTFLNYYIGVLCFYKLLSGRFGSKKFGIIGMLMMILYPRFFAESFYNNKDIIFTAWYIICAYLIDLWFRRRDLKTSVLLAFALALTCNTRLNGIVFFPILIAFFLFDSLRNRQTKGLSALLLIILLSLVFFYLITPNFWENPLKALYETLHFNFHHPNHSSEGNLFKGVLVDAAHTITFIPVWITITTPVVYLLFIVFGTILYISETIKMIITGDFRSIRITDGIMFISSFGAAAFIILAHVTIYNGWRHCYFAWPGFVYFAVFVFSVLSERKQTAIRNGCGILLGLSMLYNTFWIVKNHPFEYVYFSPIAREKAGEFSGDYWSISSRRLLEYISENNQLFMMNINHLHTQAGSINRGLLPEEKQKYIELTEEEGSDVHYYIICRDEIPDVDIFSQDFEKVYSIVVDKDEIGAVFKNKILIEIESIIDN